MFGSLLSQNKMGTEFTPLESCPNPKLELFVLFWVAEENPGRLMFKEASSTRERNIKNSFWYNAKIHKVYSVPIMSLHEIEKHIKAFTRVHGGKKKIQTREVGIFFHSGNDGSIIYTARHDPEVKGYPSQLAILGGWDAIDFNWKINKTKGLTQDYLFVFYGCNSRDIENNNRSFADKISSLDNCKDVLVVGQSTFSAPSSEPNIRSTGAFRSLDCFKEGDEVYMVSVERGTAFSAHIPYNEPQAKSMNFFKNGRFIFSESQSFFNRNPK